MCIKGSFCRSYIHLHTSWGAAKGLCFDPLSQIITDSWFQLDEQLSGITETLRGERFFAGQAPRDMPIRLDREYRSGGDLSGTSVTTRSTWNTLAKHIPSESFVELLNLPLHFSITDCAKAFVSLPSSLSSKLILAYVFYILNKNACLLLFENPLHSAECKLEHAKSLLSEALAY